MSRNQRKLTIREFGKLYHRMENVPLDECWYCGSPRTCLDHCPPVSYLDSIDVEVFRKRGGKFTLVPSCDSCNQFLGKRKLLSPNERISWLLGAYHKLFDKAYYGWSEEEIAEMGYNFKVMISHSMGRADSYVEKIRAIEQRIIDIPEWGEPI